MDADAPLALRAARRDDAEALSALVNSAYRGDSSRVGWTTEAELLGGQRTDAAALRDFIAQGETMGDRVLLMHERAAGTPGDGAPAADAAQIDACVQLERHGDEAYLGMFTVRPTLQGGGLGRRLLAGAEQDARRRWGVTAVHMTVIAQRAELIAWYERRGYRATGGTAPFPYGDARFGEPLRPDLHFVVLRKALHAGPSDTGHNRRMASTPLVIAHRGASGHRPEHTLESYRLAIEMGADFIEPDLVSTKDGRLVARHEPDITQTTDVAQRSEFADRKRSVVIDGVEHSGWFTVDFTLAELRTLRAVQPRPYRSKDFDGMFAVPTLEEIIALAKAGTASTGRAIGIYPETKHPTWHCEQGLPLEHALLAALDTAGWTTREAPVFIQCFESGNLRWLRQRTGVRLVQLIDGGGLEDDGRVQPPPRWQGTGACRLYPQGEVPTDFTDPRSFAVIAEYADAVGPWKRHIVGSRRGAGPEAATDDTERTRCTTAPTRFVELAHAAGLEVHPWTFRDEPMHLAAGYGGDPAAEYRQFAALGVDALFSDFPDTAVAALRVGVR